MEEPLFQLDVGGPQRHVTGIAGQGGAGRVGLVGDRARDDGRAALQLDGAALDLLANVQRPQPILLS